MLYYCLQLSFIEYLLEQYAVVKCLEYVVYVCVILNAASSDIVRQCDNENIFANNISRKTSTDRYRPPQGSLNRHQYGDVISTLPISVTVIVFKLKIQIYPLVLTPLASTIDDYYKIELLRDR